MTVRTEHDSLGAVDIPADRYWGAQTARALAHFPDAPPRMPVPVIRAFGLQKQAAAGANMDLGVLDETRGRLIVRAAGELVEGRFDADFPLPVWQTGSGTQTNMCANEVLANRANELSGQPLGTRSPVHPNDHVNRSQSSNDSFPTVMHVAAVMRVEGGLLPAIEALRRAVRDQQARAGGTVRLGRTHLNDAVPMHLAQLFAGWGAGLSAACDRVSAATDGLRDVPQGGTAAGSGLNAPPGFDRLFCARLSDLAGTRFTPAPVKGEAMAGHDALAALSAGLKGAGLTVLRVANDIRHLASGPRAGLGELQLPDDGLSSSIMPGKRNATQAEAMIQIVHRIVGNDATVQMANASSLFELNVAKPVLIAAVLESVELLAAGLPAFADFVAGIAPDADRMARNVEMSLMLATALTPDLGYDRVADLTRQADAERRSIRDVVLASGALSAERFDALTDPQRLAGPQPEGETG